MKWKNKISIIIILFSICVTTRGQQIKPFFKTFSKEFLGLQENGVMSVYQDPNGYLWFCTLSGLIRWDGYHIKSIPVDPLNPKVLPDPRVSSIVMDKSGKYWIVNRSGLMIYDPGKPLDSSVTRLDTIHKTWKNLPDLSNISKPIQLRIDNKGIIWAAINEKNGILKINPSKLTFEFIEVQSENKTEKLNFYDIQIDNKNEEIWALSKNFGVCKISLKTGKVIRFENTLKKELQRIWNEKDDILQKSQFWWSTDGYLWCMAKDKPFVHFNLTTLKANIFHIKGIEKFTTDPAYEWERCLEDNQGNFWVTNFTNGLIFIEKATKSGTVLRADVSDLGSLAHNLTNKITMDNSGNIWIAHRNAGVSCFSYYYPGPHTFYPLKLAKEQHPDNYHLDLHYDENSNENLYTFTGVFQKKFGSVHYTQLQSIKQNPLPSKDGHLWTNENNKIQYLGTKSGHKKLLTNDVLHVVEKHVMGRFLNNDKNNEIWMIVPDQGLFRYSTENGNLVLVSDDKELFFEKKDKLISIYFDKLNRLWLHLDNGFAMKKQDNTWQKWTDSGPEAVSLIQAPIEKMIFDHNNFIWCISRNNIIRFDGHKFTQMDHLKPYSFIRNLAIFNIKKEIWIGNFAGAVQYNPISGNSTFYPVENGVYRIRVDSFGKVALVNLETVSYVYPEYRKKAKPKPAVKITDFKIFEIPHAHLLIEKNITLNHNQNFITLYFANQDFLKIEEYDFSYQLEGVDLDWVKPSDGRKFASYSKLEPGNYTFKVRMYSNANLSEFVEDSINIKINTPWFRTLWFKFIILIISLGFFVYLIKLRIDKKLLVQKTELEKQFILENERSRIARDMHDDLGSGLSAINLLSNFLKNEKLDENSYKQIEKIASSSTELNQKLREIVWSMNPGHDYIQNLGDFIRRYIHDLQDIYKHIKFSFIITESLPDINIPKMIQKELFLCVKEAVHNAIKHSGSDVIDVSMSVNYNTLILRITDQGKGFDTSIVDASGGNGIKNIRERMVMINGSINFSKDQGHTVELTYTLPK